jgi:CRP-like cAMP-binding protein
MIIEDGTADVLIDGNKVATLGPGDFFGEIGLLEHVRRTATVVAATPMRLAVVATREFMTLADEMPDVKEKIAEAASQRMAEQKIAAKS